AVLFEPLRRRPHRLHAGLRRLGPGQLRGRRDPRPAPEHPAGARRRGGGVHTRGPAGGGLVAAIILTSIIGTLNGCFLTSPRVYFAQARDGLFFRRFAAVHPRFQTPAFSIVAQAIWASVLVLSGTYETLAGYAMFGLWIFYALMVLGVV